MVILYVYNNTIVSVETQKNYIIVHNYIVYPNMISVHYIIKHNRILHYETMLSVIQIDPKVKCVFGS